MDETRKKYIQILKQLRNTDPVLENPGNITNEIMIQVQNKKSSKNNKALLNTTRAIMALAALWLIGFFLFEINRDVSVQSNGIVNMASVPELSSSNEGDKYKKFFSAKEKFSFPDCFKQANKQEIEKNMECLSRIIDDYKSYRERKRNNPSFLSKKPINKYFNPQP